MPIRKTHEQFIAEISDKNPKITVLGKYINSNTHIECQCTVCGHIWPAAPSHLLNGHGCRKCANSALSNQRKDSEDTFLKKFNEKTKNIELLERYSGCKKPIKCKCLLCGNEWKAKPYLLFSKGGRNGCPECGLKAGTNKHRMKQNDFENALIKVNPDVEILGNYKTRKDKILTRCKRCGHEWNPAAGNLLAGYGCPKCNHGSTSYPEQAIYYALKKVLGESEVISRDLSAIGKEIDIYLPSYNFGIEYGSWHWHKDRLDQDREKIILCQDAGINLLSIIDNCPDNNTLEGFICYKPKLERKKELLRELINNILLMIDSGRVISEEEFQKITLQAYASSNKRNTSEFIELMKTVNPNIQILGEYCGTHEKIKCRDMICGHIWDAIPERLLMGAGCRECAKNKKKTHEEFTSAMKEKYPNIVITGKYINSTTPISYECTICGSNYVKNPVAILYGTACNTCLKIQTQKKKHSEFVATISIRHPEIEVLSEYTDVNSILDCRCRKCGYTWQYSYSRLMEKQGTCPKCTRKTDYLRKHFKELIAETLPDIDVQSNYITAHEKISCVCKKCGYEWNPPARELLNGKGCIYCEGAKRRIAQIDLATGNILHIYSSVVDAAAKMNTSDTAIISCCRNKTKSSSGYGWEYYT